MQLTDVLMLVVREGVRRHVEKRAGVMLPLAVGAMLPGIVHKAMERAHSTEHQLEQSRYNPMKMAAMPPWASIFGSMMGQGASTAGRAIGSGAASAGRAVGNQMLGQSGSPKGPSGLKGSFGELGASPISGVAKGISGGIGRRVDKMFGGHDFGEKKDPMHMGAGAAITSFGKEMGTSGANLLRDIANKAMEAAGHAGDASAREAIIGELKRTDSVLANADDGTLMEAYHTMTRFAPVLSTDKNAVRSFLRQAVMSGSGPDFMSIKLLADSERAVTGDDKRASFGHSKRHSSDDVLRALTQGGLIGAGAGAAGGAALNSDDRLDGALKGGLLGGGIGAIGGAANELRKPKSFWYDDGNNRTQFHYIL